MRLIVTIQVLFRSHERLAVASSVWHREVKVEGATVHFVPEDPKDVFCMSGLVIGVPRQHQSFSLLRLM
jgi:hypothetical protein